MIPPLHVEAVLSPIHTTFLSTFVMEFESIIFCDLTTEKKKKKKDKDMKKNLRFIISI